MAFGSKMLTPIFAASLIASGISQPARAQFGALTLGAVLAKLLGDVNSTIQGAIGGALAVEVQAGGQIAGLIQQAQAAYTADLNITFDKLSAAEKQTVNDIASITEEFSKNTAAAAKDVMQRTQQVANTVPLAGLFPQLTSYSPVFAVPISNSSGSKFFALTIQGNFADVYRNGFEAQATIGGHTIKNMLKTTQTISFEVPITDLKQPNPGSLSPNQVDIRIPYQTSSLLGQGKTEMAQFSLVVSTLPPKVGEIGFQTLFKTPSVNKKTFTTGEIQQESGDDDIKCGGEHGDLAIHTVQADPGWTIIPSTVEPVVTWSQGKQGPDQDWWIANNCSTELTACICVSTEHHRFGTSGKVHFHMTYIAQQPSTALHSNSDFEPLQWGFRKVWSTAGASNWSISLKRFDGRAIDASGPFSDEFLQISTSGSDVTVQTYPFQ